MEHGGGQRIREGAFSSQGLLRSCLVLPGATCPACSRFPRTSEGGYRGVRSQARSAIQHPDTQQRELFIDSSELCAHNLEILHIHPRHLRCRRLQERAITGRLGECRCPKEKGESKTQGIKEGRQAAEEVDAYLEEVSSLAWQGGIPKRSWVAPPITKDIKGLPETNSDKAGMDVPEAVAVTASA